jgi:hypothetical protein
MRSMYRFVPTAARLMLGGLFVSAAAMHFLHAAPQPELPHGAEQFAMALAASGYFMTLLKLVELGAGLMLLASRGVPLALVILAPVVVNILAFHAFLAPGGLGLALVLTALETYLVIHHRGSFLPLLHGRRPEVAAPREEEPERLAA